MSSSGRYQSNIFNFLSRQRLRLKDQMDYRVRQVTLVGTWGAQILLYPLYALFQTSRLTGRQLGQAVRNALPRLRSASRGLQTLIDPEPPSALTVDSPVWKTMAVLQSFELPLDIQPESMGLVAPRLPSGPEARSLPPSEPLSRQDPVSVRGLATHLSSQTLVLVTADNQILDRLTPQQQHRLHERMAWELATFYREQRLATPLARPEPQLLIARQLPPPLDRPQQLPLIRGFYRLMIWMQTGPVAIAMNLFQEARIMPSPPHLPASSPRALPPSSPASPGASLAAGPTARFSLLQMARSLSKGMLARQNQTVGEGQWFDPDRHPVDSEKRRFLSLPDRVQPRPSTWSANWRDAPERPLGGRSLQTIAAERWPGRDRLQQLQKLDGALAVAQNREVGLGSPAASDSEPAQALSRSDVSTLEAKVTLVGYVKHPLEQILEWLDQGMVWLENAIARMWAWFKRQ